MADNVIKFLLLINITGHGVKMLLGNGPKFRLCQNTQIMNINVTPYYCNITKLHVCLILYI
jgi:hypothetical protein